MKRLISLIFLIFVFSAIGQELDIQGHRGARGLLPENSIIGFLRAIDEGVTTLEMDVVITKDKTVVVSHEPYMSPAICLDSAGNAIKDVQAHNIYELTYDEVALYDCGISGNDRFPKQEKVSTNKPLLEDVINTVESYLKTRNLPNVGYNIELKSTEKGDNAFHPAPEEFSDIVARLLSANLDKIRYTIQCFDFRILNYWHKSYPETTLVALVSNNKGLEANLNELDFVPSAYSPNHSLVNQALINDCHAKSMKIIPWTVNNLQRMEELVEMGVDGIITDYPDIAKALK